jgi:protein phosphatase
LILDEDYLLLLCSDGLSDKDRVEQYWDSQILPILTQGISLATVGNQLVELANEKNGHDNVTIALFHCQVIAPKTTTNLVWSEIKPFVPTIPPDDNSGDMSQGEMPTLPIRQFTDTEVIKPSPSPISPQESKVVPASSQSQPQSKPLIMALLLVIVAGLGVLGYLLFGNKDNLTTTPPLPPPPTQPDRPPDPQLNNIQIQKKNHYQQIGLQKRI